MSAIIDRGTAEHLLDYADEVLAATVGTGEGGRAVVPPFPDEPAHLDILDEELGAFSTLKISGKLRGCIGNFAGTGSLREVLPRVVRESALADPRFPAVGPEELHAISLSLSILLPARPIASPDEIQPGRDGTILTHDRHRAVFLPEVATEQGWDVPTMLSMLCRKARLPEWAWESSATQLEVFQTIHISRGPDGTVVIEGGET